MRITATILAVTTALALLSSLPAAAQDPTSDPPPNDDYANATDVTTLPHSETYDPRGAGTEPTEPFPSCAPNPQYSLPASLSGNPTTWYRIAPEADLTLSVDMAGSDGYVSLGLYDVTGLEGAGVTATVATEIDCVRRSGRPLHAALRAGRTYMVQTETRFTTTLTLTFAVIDAGSELPAPLPIAVEAEDGAMLRGHAHLPAGEGPFATVLEFGVHYGNTLGRSTDVAIGDDSRRWALLEAGFAVALVNARGSGASDGCLQLGSQLEGRDAARVVRAIAQADWSTGRVGMIGTGYAAMTGFGAVASGQAEGLEAVVANGAIVDIWSLNATNGVTYQEDAGYLSRFRAQAGAPDQVTEVGTSTPTHAACPDQADYSAHDVPVWNGDRTAWHDDRDRRGGLTGTDVAVMAHVGLWRDNTEGRTRAAVSRQLDDLWNLLDGDRWFLLGQHAVHGGASYPDLIDREIDWLDRHLRDGQVDVPGRRVDYQSDDGDWHRSNQWPPRKASTLHLDGPTLTDDDPAEGGARGFAAANHTPLGCDADEELVYVSEPLAKDLELAGHFTLDLTLESNLPDGTVAAMLYAGEPCGELREVSHALASLRHARDERGESFPIGTPTAVSFESMPFATTVRAGERLVLALGSAGWNTMPDTVLPELTIHTGPDGGSTLTLPDTKGRRAKPSVA